MCGRSEIYTHTHTLSLSLFLLFIQKHAFLPVNSDKCDDALGVLKEALKDVCLENMRRTSLLNLQKALQKEGKTFPYEVPLRVRK
jgi:hypothetical protein